MPNTTILKIRDILLYVVDRYDRKKNGHIWERLHQEDFCQIAGIDPTEKYESDGGLNQARCFSLLSDMKLGGSGYEFSKITRVHFKTLLQIIGFRSDCVLKRLDTLIKKIVPESEALCAELSLDAVAYSSVYAKIISVIRTHCMQLKNQTYVLIFFCIYML